MNEGFTPRRLLPVSAYLCLIVYASLFPFSGWRWPASLWGWLGAPLPCLHHISRKDLFVNFVAYLPLGMLVLRCFPPAVSRRWALCGAILAGFGLSLSMETLQTLLPARDPFLVDLAANSAGTAAGAILWGGIRGNEERIAAWRAGWLAPGADAGRGAAALLLWLLARGFSLLPELPYRLRIFLAHPFHFPATTGAPFDSLAALIGLCDATALALVAVTVLRPRVRPIALFSATVAAVFLAGTFLAGRPPSSAEQCGWLAGICLAAAVSSRFPGRVRWLGMACLVAAAVLFELKPGTGKALLQEFNLRPFRFHLDNTMFGIAQILHGSWRFAALAFFATSGRTDRFRFRTLAVGGAAIVLGVSLLELAQEWIPGRTPDITQVLIALAGWFLPFIISPAGTPHSQPATESHRKR